MSASTPEKDLVETGFNAGSRAGEFSAKGFTILLTQRIEDVTAKVKAGSENLSGAELAAAVKKNSDDLKAAEQAKAPKGSTIAIQAIDTGYFYYLYETSEIKDIRMVYAPPRNIGVYGGDPDNFEWTRHTGDFSFLRAYVAPDGSPATYSWTVQGVAVSSPPSGKKHHHCGLLGLEGVAVLGLISLLRCRRR